MFKLDTYLLTCPKTGSTTTATLHAAYANIQNHKKTERNQACFQSFMHE